MTFLQSANKRRPYPAALFLSGMALLASSVLYAQEDDDDFFFFDEEEEQAPQVADPLESINRVTFAFNDKLYRVVLKPVARSLRVLPVPVRKAGSNFFSNLGAPISAFSALFQADLTNSGTELGRFVINSTVGILGLFDPATEMGIIQDEEDIGQGFARWGIGHGFYLVLPFYGASSLRDTIGTIATSAINPVYDDLTTEQIIALKLTNVEIALSLDEDSYEAFYGDALDPYIFFRSAWVQSRAGKVEK